MSVHLSLTFGSQLKEFALKSNLRCVTLAVYNGCAIGVGWSSFGVWGKLIDVKTSFYLRSREWKPICGTYDLTAVGQSDLANNKKGAPSDPPIPSNASGVSYDSFAERLHRLRCMTSAPTLCWQKQPCVYVCSYSAHVMVQRWFMFGKMLVCLKCTPRSSCELQHLEIDSSLKKSFLEAEIRSLSSPFIHFSWTQDEKLKSHMQIGFCYNGTAQGIF